MEAIGIDVTSRAARAVTIDAGGKVLHSASYPAADAVAALKAATSAAKRPEATPLGIATDDPELAGAAALGKLSSGGPPPVICRAGDALVFAEAWIGAAKGVQHAVCLWLGDRVLAGVLLNGESWRGAHGLAGSAAWLALNPVERQDYRKYGSFAAEVNDHGIAHRLAWRVQAGDESTVPQRAGGLDAIRSTHVFEGAREADGVAISVVRDTARYIAMASVNLAVALDPEVVVIGGPITAAEDLLLESTRHDFDRRLPPAMVGQVRCEFSPIGQDAIAVGAARMAMLAKT
jgi:predicted NBD/HSP70 family sugar kinase